MAKVATKKVGNASVVFQFANGKELICPVDHVHQDTIDRLTLHGIAQKVGDSYASAESVDEAFASATEVWNNLVNGIWATRATGGKIVEALSRATGKPIDDCMTAYMAMDDNAKKELRKHPAIKKAMAEIDAEKAAALAKASEGTGSDLSSIFN